MGSASGKVTFAAIARRSQVRDDKFKAFESAESKYLPVQVSSISRGATQVSQSEFVTFWMSITRGNVIVAAIQIRAIRLGRYKNINKQNNEIPMTR